MDDAEMYDVIVRIGPQLGDLVRGGIEKAYELALANGLDDTQAWRLAHVVAQREIFFVHTVMTAVSLTLRTSRRVSQSKGEQRGEKPGPHPELLSKDEGFSKEAFGAGDDFITWVEKLYDEWNEEWDEPHPELVEGG